MRKIIAALVAALATAGLSAPAATAQTGVGPVDTVIRSAETVIKSLDGGVETPHPYACEESRPEVQDMINGVRDSLKTRFPDYVTMLARGFAPYADAPLSQFLGEGHWLNPDFIEDGHIMDPKYPEGILVDKWNRPIGVMFITDHPDKAGPDMYVAEDGTPCNAWHYHTETAADAYWYLYKYLWSDAIENGEIEPEPRSPDLMHVWAYGAYKYQWNHSTPPASELPGDPSPQDIPDIVGGPRAPTGPIPPIPPVTKRLGDL